jgi:hypothetical protein
LARPSGASAVWRDANGYWKSRQTLTTAMKRMGYAPKMMA